MTKYEMEKEIRRMKNEYEEQRKRDLEVIIDKLFNYNIAKNDKHYSFLKEIEQDLEKFKTEYLV